MPDRVWTWQRLVAVTLAKSLLVGLLGLAAWGALPAALGWHPTTVSSGSMMPRLHVGDIAVSRPLGSHVPPLTSVLLFHDPDHPGRLRMHRFVRIDDDGLLVTRGDANTADDSTPVALSAVVGIGTLRVPWIALPIVWSREGRWVLLALVAAGLGLLILVATSGRDRVFDDDRADEPDAGEPGPDERDEPGSEDDSAPVSPRPNPAATRRRTSWRVAALVGAGLLATTLATPADAAFTSTTTSTGSMASATYFKCANALSAYNPTLWYRMDETSSSTTSAADSSSAGSTGVYSSTGRTPTSSTACARDSGGAMTFDGSSGYLSSPSVSSLPNTFSLAVWFRTTTTAGGKLIGFGSSQTGLSGQYDRQIYMLNNGRLTFGVYSGGTLTVSSSAAYNDGSWHLAVGTLSSAGLQLYVDKDLIASDATVTSAEPVSSAYLRVAYDNLDGWPNTPTSRFFGGTLDDAAYFTSVLTAQQVQDLYAAGS